MKKLLLLIIFITVIGCSQTPDNMVLVTGGEFTYGKGEPGSQQKTTLEDFYIDIFEVTNEKYREYIKAAGHREPSNWMLNGYDKTKATHPVTFVKLEDASTYCKWLGKSLPTEAQWERAARGTDSREYAWGSEFKRGLSNTVTSKVIGTTPVGSFPEGASPYGALDMTGNVLEWTATLMPSAEDNGDEYEGEEFYITKGGSWGYSSSRAKTFQRFPFEKDSKTNNIGFRCAKI